MTPDFPSSEAYQAEKARHPAMTVVDINAEHSGITDAYQNQVLFNINKDCMRLAGFEGEYRWHLHPTSDELFLVVSGELQIDFEHAAQVTLTEWQSIVIPAGTVHRTRAIGRTVNVTFEEQGAQTVFVEAPSNNSFIPKPLRGST